MNPRSRNAGFTISKKDLHSIYNGRTRVPKPYEAFAKLYPDAVEEEKEKRCKEGGIKGRQKLSVWHEAAKELYQSATEEQMKAVKDELGESVLIDPEDGPESPKTYLRFVFA